MARDASGQGNPCGMGGGKDNVDCIPRQEPAVPPTLCQHQPSPAPSMSILAQKPLPLPTQAKKRKTVKARAYSSRPLPRLPN